MQHYTHEVAYSVLKTFSCAEVPIDFMVVETAMRQPNNYEQFLK